AIVPFGNVTITASVGAVTRTTLIGASTLASVRIPVTLDQAMRVPADANGDGVPDWIMTQDLQVTPHSARGTVFFDLNHDGSFGTSDQPAPGAVLTLTDADFAYTRRTTSANDGTYAIADLPVGVFIATVATAGRTTSVATVSIATTDATHDISVPFVEVHGFTQSDAGGSVPSADPRTIRSTTSDGTARFSIRLGAGEWFVSGRFYGSSGLFATLGTVVVPAGATTSYQAMFVQGVRLMGTVKDANPAVVNPEAT